VHDKPTTGYGSCAEVDEKARRVAPEAAKKLPIRVNIWLKDAGSCLEVYENNR